jgi:hypothetical protein
MILVQPLGADESAKPETGAEQSLKDRARAFWEADEWTNAYGQRIRLKDVIAFRV